MLLSLFKDEETENEIEITCLCTWLVNGPFTYLGFLPMTLETQFRSSLDHCLNFQILSLPLSFLYMIVLF